MVYPLCTGVTQQHDLTVMKLAQSIFVPADIPHDVRVSVCSSGDESEYSDVSDDEDTKMVLVVRQDLKMGKGKAAAQCCHATLAAYKQARRKCPDTLRVWESSGQPKITLKCDTEEELMTLLARARSLGLVSYVVADAGRTQIAAGSHTVLAVGPAPGSVVDQVTGEMGNGGVSSNHILLRLLAT